MSVRTNYDFKITGNVLELPQSKEPIRSIEKTKVSPINFSHKNLRILNQVTKSVTSNRPESILSQNTKRTSSDSNKDQTIKNQENEICRLKKKIEELEYQFKQSQKKHKDKDKDIVNLKEEIESISKQEKCLIEKNTKIQKEINELAEKNSNLEKNLSLADKLNHDANNQINDLKLRQEDEIKRLKEENSEEIKKKDDKLEMLKKQIASAFKDNAWERQVQIDDLTKELKRKQDECDSLRQTIIGNRNNFSVISNQIKNVK